jgi:hypothetical protein
MRWITTAFRGPDLEKAFKDRADREGKHDRVEDEY